MAPNDLQELFNRLKAHSNSSEASAPPQPSLWNTSDQPTYQPPSVSSPIFSPPVQTPNPVHSSNIISPATASAAGTPAPDQNRTNNLLNLLKFNNQSTQAGPMANLQNVASVRSSATNDGGASSSSRPVSAQDLMASFQRKTSAQNVLSSPVAAGGAEKPEPVTQTGNSKDFLLNLLTKPKEVKPISLPKDDVIDYEDEPLEESKSVDNLAADLASVLNRASTSRTSRESTPIRQFGTAESETTAFVAPQPNKPSMFDYVNPFDQLHSSSPLNRPSSKTASQSEPKKVEILKHNREASADANGDAVAAIAKSIELSSQVKSPIIPEHEKSTSVSEALKGVGNQVDKEVEVALAQADAQAEQPTNAKLAAPDAGNNTADDSMAIKKTTGDVDEIDSSWESAEDEEAAKEEESDVEVYNFPMKPFVSIQIKEIQDVRPIRQEHFMHIAKLKKEFDQIDRSLVTASQSHIIYAQTATKEDNGGFRIIRQDSGQNKHVFRSSNERIFSVQICSSRMAGNDVETVLGTGVNGSIFWTSLAKSSPELFADDDVEAQGFIMPAISTPEEQSSGSQVKTRAKMSCRHPEYFAVARGHQINIISPETVKSKAYRNAKTRKVNTEKYLAEHGLKIITGKACKDFCFSEDDSVIVSLDKNGRFRFWDVRDLTSRASEFVEGKQDPVELREPIWSLQAAASGSKADEKPSVSSIMFLDKDRPMSKALALRYMLIGFKQNHILQLWDLGLGKAVQEIQLPHEKDSDGICSVAYHSRHGIITIGHPTRNSLYFIHLSAPRYPLAPMDQAKYIGHLASGENALPRPESTAIMSGLREFSFAKVGQLRSVDMLGQPVELVNASDEDKSNETIFELYVMHSRGVVGMAVKRKDMGWDDDSKILNAKDGIDAGVIAVGDLIMPKLLPPSEPSSIADTASTAKQTPTPKKKSEAAKSLTNSAAGKADIIKKEVLPSPRQSANGSSQATKQVADLPTPSKLSTASTAVSNPPSYAMAAQRVKVESPEKGFQEAEKRSIAPSSNPTALAALSGDGMDGLLNKHFEALYERIDADKRIAEAAGGAKQDAMLRLISKTLTENVERSLSDIVGNNITQTVVPSINNTLEKQVSDAILPQLTALVAKELKAILPGTVQQCFKDPGLQNTISNQVAQKIQQQVNQTLQQLMSGLATQVTQAITAETKKAFTDLEARNKQQLQQAETRRQQDGARIQELSNLVQGLSQMVQNMSETQAAFQEQILKMQRPASQAEASQQTSSKDAESATTAAPDPQKTAEEQEVELITQHFMAGEYDKATVAWLQSPRQGELFDLIFVRINPRYLEKVNPLLALSVSAAITASLETQMAQRMDWLGAALENIDLNDPDSKDIAPKVMDVLSNRLQGAYMRTSESNPSDPVLGKMSAMHRRVMEVRRLAG